MIDPESTELTHELAALKRVASALLRNAAAADDIVQDAWLASVGSEERSPAERRSWLQGVVRNLARSDQRDQARRHYRETRAARSECVDVEAEYAHDQESVRQLLADAVDALDEPYATVIRERFLLAKSTAEIAANARRAESTIRRQVQRGIEQLRRQLGPQFGGGQALGIALVHSFEWRSSDLVEHGGWTASVSATIGGGLWWFKLLWVAPIVAGVLALLHLSGAERATQSEETLTPIPQLETGSTVSAASGLAAALDAKSGYGGRATIAAPDPQAALAPQSSASQAEPAAAGASPLRRVRRQVVHVLDAAGTPVVGAEIQMGVDGEWAPAATAGARGRAEFDWKIKTDAPVDGRVESAELRLRARAPQHADSGEHVVPLKGSDQSLTLRLRGPEQVITGVVLSPDGEAISGAQIAVDPDPLEQGRARPAKKRVSADGGEYFPLHRGTATDAHGRFTLKGLTREAHVLTARSRGLMDAQLTVDEAGEATATAEFALREGAVITGVVLGPDGRRAGGVELHFEPLHSDRTGARSLVSGADGTFRIDGAQVGDGRVRGETMIDSVRHLGLSDMVLRNGQVEHVVVQLERSKDVHIRIVDAEGRAVVSAGLIVTNEIHQWKTLFLPLDRQGKAVVASVPETRLLVMVIGADSPFPFALHAIDPTRATDFELVSPRSHVKMGTVSGRVRLGGEAPPTGARVRIEQRTSTAAREVEIADADGAFRLEGIPPGDYFLSLLTPAMGTQLICEHRGEGAEHDLGTVDLAPAGAISAEWAWPSDDGMTYKLLQIFHPPEGYLRRLYSIAGGGIPQGAPIPVMSGSYGFAIKNAAGETVQLSAAWVAPEIEQPIYLGPRLDVSASIEIALDGYPDGYPDAALSIAVHAVPDRPGLDDASETDLAQLVSDATHVTQAAATKCWGGEYWVSFPMDREQRWILSVAVPSGRTHTMLVHSIPGDRCAHTGFTLSPEGTRRHPTWW